MEVALANLALGATRRLCQGQFLGIVGDGEQLAEENAPHRLPCACRANWVLNKNSVQHSLPVDADDPCQSDIPVTRV